ncbi:unnamed protein product [Arctia plantaginis]|uniref:Uncharacterized protein n=1 Tax=Arctia plantaginis TaxID=874455 RepID=A0A8S0YYF1_ARCPL|nr:unnamed protein product [Arctia plantaginis]
MITRARSRALLTSPDSSLRSVLPSPEATTEVPAVFFFPPTSHTPVRQQGSGPPPTYMGSRGSPTWNRVLTTGGDVHEVNKFNQ